MEHLEKAIITTIWDDATYTKHQGGKLPKELLSPYVPAIKTLSERYVSPKRANTRPKLDQTMASAYLLYYLPINHYKIFHLLENLEYTITHSSPLRVLDIGAGPGTASLALMDYMGQTSNLELTLVEPCAHMQYFAGKVLDQYRYNHNFNSSIHNSTSDLSNEKFDLIIFSNVLNECSGETKLAFLELISNHLDTKGTIVVVEPALQQTTRALMEYRNQILNHISGIKVMYPCFRQDACPMLEKSETDWCHNEIRWEVPKLVEQIDLLTGFNKHRIKASYVAFSYIEHVSSKLRIVSKPSHNKLGASCLVCGNDYFGKVKVSKASRAYKLIKKAKMYDSITSSYNLAIQHADPSQEVALIELDENSERN